MRGPPLQRPRAARKLLRPDRQGTRGARRGSSRLLREAQALAGLSHPNSVAIPDVGAVGGKVFVAMELVEGATLHAWLAEKPRSPRAIFELFLRAGRGLAAAHGAGLVHRDIEPENVLVSGRAFRSSTRCAEAATGAQLAPLRDARPSRLETLLARCPAQAAWR
jgi:serine/threonine protein kinase